MRNILTIAQKELVAYFTSPMGYVAMLFFLVICGLIFVLSTAMSMPKADLTPMLHTMVFLSLLICPAITMGLLAQETNSGTYEMLMTKPVRDIEVVIGKYLGALGLYLAIIVLSLEFLLIFKIFGQPDMGQTLAGYIGLILTGMAFLAVGVFASSLTSNQIAAWAIGVTVLLFLWLVGWLSYSGSGVLGVVAKSISAYESFEDFKRGIVDAKNIIYFLSVMGFFLFLTVRSLESRRTV